MYCEKCGTKNDDDSMFCTNCGTDLQKIDTVEIQKTVKKDIGKFKNIKGILKIVVVIIIIVTIISAFILIQKNNVNGNNDSGQIQGASNQEMVDISISSIPSGVHTYIDNVSKGNTPITIKLSEGNYSLKMNLTGYNGVESNFSVTSDMARQEINVTLESING